MTDALPISEYLWNALFAYYGSTDFGSGSLVGPDDANEHAIIIEDRTDLPCSLEDVQRYVSSNPLLMALGKTLIREIEGLLNQLTD